MEKKNIYIGQCAVCNKVIFKTINPYECDMFWILGFYGKSYCFCSRKCYQKAIKYEVKLDIQSGKKFMKKFKKRGN